MADQSSVNTTPNRERTYPPGYGTVEPVANYRPWDIDREFQAVYEQVRDCTMVDIYRLWLLWTLARGLPSGAARGDLLEIGSWRGGSGAVLAAAMQRDAGRRLFLADTFAGVVKASSRDTYYKGGEHANTSPELVRSLLDGMGLDNVELLVGTFPDETGHAVEECLFALCHIDVDVYQSARDAFLWVWPRLVEGGVVVFDDYGFYGCEGVTACVEEVASELDDGIVIPNLTGQAVVVKSGLRGR